MIIKSFFSVFLLSLCVTTSYAETTKEKLKVQLVAKQEQLDVLGEKIMQFHSNFVDSLPKTIELAKTFFETRKRQLVSEGIAEQDVMKVFGEEFEHFGKSYIAHLINGTSDQIVKDAFFRGIENAPILKFRVIKFVCDFVVALDFLYEWKKVSDEYVALASQLGLTIGLDTLVPSFKGCAATESVLQQVVKQVLQILGIEVDSDIAKRLMWQTTNQLFEQEQKEVEPEVAMLQPANQVSEPKQSEVGTEGAMPQPTVEQLTNQLRQTTSELQQTTTMLQQASDELEIKNKIIKIKDGSALIDTLLCVEIGVVGVAVGVAGTILVDLLSHRAC